MSTPCLITTTIPTKVLCHAGAHEESSSTAEGNKTARGSDRNNLLPLGSINSGFFPTNVKIRYDIEILRGRIQKAVDMISETFGCQFTFSLEPGCEYV